MIYDCFLFFQELDILEIRLNELYDVVDYFVIHESTKTHSGNPKNLIFKENKNRFKKFSNKIIYKVINDTPDNYLDLRIKKNDLDSYNFVINRINLMNHFPKNVSSYGRDTFEKESLIRSLTNCKNDDIILLSDCDEIPKKDTLIEIIKYFDCNQIYHFSQDMFYYFLNLRKNEDWHGTIALSYNSFLENSFCEMRTYKKGTFVDKGGWHFSYMGGINSIRNKLESFGEQSVNLPIVKNNLDHSISNAILLNRDLFGRQCKFWKVPLDDKMPEYLVNNQERYKDYIL